MVIFVALSCLLSLLGVQPTLGQTTCAAPSTILTSDADITAMINSKPGDCTTLTGNLVFGHQDCSVPCTLTSLAALNNVNTIEGSITIQCCNSLTSISFFPLVRVFTGNLRIYYNSELSSINGFDMLQSMDGSIIISQNSKLVEIGGFGILRTISGYLDIEYNTALLRFPAMSQVSTIGGEQLSSGHALVVIHNTNLASLASLSSLQTISYGTVHIEGNTALCYAGYPTWNVGSYAPRLDDAVSGVDRGIDWRSKLATSEMWQYTWGLNGGGYPTLYIRDNAQDCESASCHSSCPTNSGCLGPDDDNLCGSCATIGTLNTCASSTPSTTEPTQTTGGGGGSTGVIVGVVIVILVVIVVVVAVVIVLLVVFGRKCRLGSSGSFDIKNFSSEEDGLTSAQSSDLIASSNNGQSKFEKRSNKQDMNNVVMISKNSDEFRNQEVNVIFNKNATSNSSPQVVLRDKAPKFVQKSSTENLSSSHDGENNGTDLADLGEEEPEFIPETEKSTEPSKGESVYDRSSSTVDIDRLKQGSSDINISFPKDQVKLGKQIGVGEFGKVLQAEARKLIPGQKKTNVVVKQLKQNATKEEKDDFLRPVEAMKILKHQNVLSLMGVVSSGPNILVMLEDCSLGNFKTFLVSKRRESVSMKGNGQLLKMAKDLGAGLGYLHSMTIAHNDLAVRNCLVAKDGTIKLGDYGISRQLFKEDYYSRSPGDKAWPIRWMAPEQVIHQERNVLDSHPVSMAANIWSLGVTLWEVCSFAQWPYDEMSNEEVIQMVVRTGKCTLECPFDSGETLVFLYACCQLCWQDEGYRPTIEEIISMLNEPSTISNKRRKSSLTRQHLILPQSRSKTLPASSMPALATKRSSDSQMNSEMAIMKRVPLSDAKPARSNGTPTTSEKMAMPVKPSTVSTPASQNKNQPTVEGTGNSNKSIPSNEAAAPSKSETRSSQDNNTGTLRKPKRPAPVKPAPKVPPQTQKHSTNSSNEPTKTSVHPAPKRAAPIRTAPIRTAPKHPNATPTKRDSAPTHKDPAPSHQDLDIKDQNDTGSKRTQLEKVKSEGSNKVKRVHSYRSNRKANEVVKSLQADKAKNNAREETKKSSPKVTSSSIPSATNFGFGQTEAEAEEKSEDAIHDSFESDFDETYFLGGAESLPQEDFILDPPEHFSESSISELEESQTEVPDTVKKETGRSNAPDPVIHKDQGGMTMQFMPPAVSDDDEETTTSNVVQIEDKNVDDGKKEPESSSRDEDALRAKRARKKKKKRASRDITDDEDTLRKERRKKKKAAKQLKSKEDRQEEDKEEMLPEFLHDRGLDRVPMKSSQDYSTPFSRSPPMKTSQDMFTNSIASYRSNESLDAVGNVKKRHKSYYGDVKATDEFTPPWLEDDPDEGNDDDDPYPGDDAPPNVVYDEEVSSLLW